MKNNAAKETMGVSGSGQLRSALGLCRAWISLGLALCLFPTASSAAGFDPLESVFGEAMDSARRALAGGADRGSEVTRAAAQAKKPIVPGPSAPAKLPWRCTPRGAYGLCSVRALAQSCGEDSPFARTLGDLRLLERSDPRLLLNLAKLGLGVRFDLSGRALRGASAKYHPVTKEIILQGDGRHALWMAGIAMDDALRADTLLDGLRAALRVSARGDKGLERLRFWRNSAHGAIFDSASSPQFLDAYRHYAQSSEAGSHWMSSDPQDVQSLVQAHMHAFIWYLDPEGRHKKDELAIRWPFLRSWVEDTLQRFANMRDTQLFEARLESASHWPPLGLNPGEAQTLRERVLVGFSGAAGRGRLPEARDLDAYCGLAQDPLDPEGYRPSW